MSGGWSRKDFLRAVTGGAAAASVAGSGRQAEAFSLLRVPEALPPEREVPTFCELCFWNCGVVARVRKNRVLSLVGHPGYPTSRGRLCGRGNAGAAAVRDEDRLRHPLVRVGRRGEGRFRRAGWKEAYRIVAEAFGKVKAEHGAQALALFYHGSGAPFLRTMMVAYGSPNYAAPAYAQCKGPRDVGYALTFGQGFPSPEPLDLEQARAIVLFGSHLGENAHNSQVQELVAALRRGARLVVLDPRLSTVASKAEVWLPVRPGSDLAVILAWIHLLLRDEAWDRDFVRTHCLGLDELRAHVREATPAWAAAEAGVEEAAIVRAYEILRQARPAVVVHPGRHATWYGEADTQRARGQAILTALLGAWWTPGGIYRAERPSLPEFPGPDFPDLPPNVDRAAGRFPFAPEVTTNGVREATLTGKPYPVRGWLVYGSNLLHSLPGRRQTLEAIGKLDVLAVCDVIPSELTRYADVVFPEDVYLERHDDLLLGSGREPYVGLRQPAVRSPHDTRPAWRIAKELGTELGVGDFFAFESFEEYLEARLAGSGTSLTALRGRGFHALPRKTPLFLAPREAHVFQTPSGKVELFSRRLAEAGFDPLPAYRPQPAPLQGTLRLLYGRSPLHSFARTQNNPILSDLDPTNTLWMNPRPAAARGLADGALVTVRSTTGGETGPLALHLTERMPEDAVYMVHGFGQRAPGLSRADGRGGDDTALLDAYAVDPISGATGMRTAFVTVAAAPAGRS